jgi:hypothetical protein
MSNGSGGGGPCTNREARHEAGACRDSLGMMRSAVCSRQRINRSRVRFENYPEMLSRLLIVM